ncbi:hypothetical protein BH23ACT6_BH23ACT6_24990 [soil metagenome]
MDMVGAIASSMHRDQLNSGWPTSGATHEGFLGAAERIHQAAINIEESPDRNRAATTRQAFGVLYHGAHLIRTGMEDYISHQFAHQHGRDLHRSVPMMHRIHRSEQLLDVAVNPWPWAGSSLTDQAPTQQLAATFARWDIAAHRALVVPSATAIRIVATGEAYATRSAGVLLGAAHSLETGIAVSGDSTRLAGAITTAAERWQDLAVAANRNSFATSADRGAHEALISIRRSLGQILLDGPRPASADHLAATIDLNAASRVSHQVLIASADLGKAAEATVGNPGLHGSTRALLQQQREVQGDEVNLINPDQGSREKTMPIPPKLRGPLRSSSTDVVNATDRAASLVMVAHPPGPSPAEPGKAPSRRPEHLLGPSRPIGPPGPDR